MEKTIEERLIEIEKTKLVLLSNINLSLCLLAANNVKNIGVDEIAKREELADMFNQQLDAISEL